MHINNKFIIPVLITFLSFTSYSSAHETVWSFDTGQVDNSGDYFGNELSIDSDNDGTPELTIQAWSDTGRNNKVRQGFASRNSYGLLNYNLSNRHNLKGEYHAIDNHRDVDMMLFSFTESTSLIGIDLSWYGKDSDISIAAFNKSPDLEGNTWSHIASNAIFKESIKNIGRSPYTLANKVSGVVVEAKYWLIGAYAAAFENKHWDAHIDAIKIASIKTKTTKNPESKPPMEVAEPSTIAVFASFGLFLIWRRKRAI